MLAIQLPEEIEQRLDALTKATGRARESTVLEAIAAFLNGFDAARNAPFPLVRLREAAQVGFDDLDAGRCRSFAGGAQLGRHLAERAKTVLGPIAG